jgi:hypothetical protein
MALSNSEKQAAWRKRRNAKAKLADNLLLPSFDGNRYDQGSALMKLIEAGGISTEDKEAAVMKLLTTKGEVWGKGFASWVKAWKPGRTAIRRRRSLKGGLLSEWSPELLKVELSDLKLADYDLKLTGFEDFKLEPMAVNFESLDPTARAREQEIAKLKAKLKKQRARNRAARQMAPNPSPAIAADPK